MARATSGLGQFRGKVGAVVFRVSQGQQIASAYQPAVKNPKTNLQTAQRDKMYLASQISKLVPRADIVGLNPRGSARDRRNMLIKNVIDYSGTSMENGVFKTVFPAQNLKLSNGRKMEDYINPSLSSQSGSPITIAINASIGEETYNSLALKLVQFDVINDAYSAYKSSWLELPPFDESGVSLSASFTTTQGSIFYLIPVLLNQNVRYSSERKTLIQISENSSFDVTGEYGINQAVYEWCDSMFIGTSGGGEVVPPYIPDDEVVNPDGPSFPNLG